MSYERIKMRQSRNASHNRVSRRLDCNRVIVGTHILNWPFDQVRLAAFGASLKFGGDAMNQQIKPGQNGSNAQKDQKPADAQRDQKDPRDQPKAGKAADTGSSSNSMPGSGPG
jgi:hypothetical protein